MGRTLSGLYPSRLYAIIEPIQDDEPRLAVEVARGGPSV